MKPFALTRKAKADLHGIAIRTEQRWGKDQRNHYIKQLDEAFQLLANTPPGREELRRHQSRISKVSSRRHVIFYRDDSDSTVEIVRILHESMDVDSAMTGG